MKLAHYVEHDLRRVLSSHVVPVALPGPEEQAPKGSAVGARPAIGPVVPLAATGGGEGGDLVGRPSHPAQRVSDPIGTRVLIRGDAIAAPPGRADDFSWPRADANAAPDAAPEPIAPAPPVTGQRLRRQRFEQADATKTTPTRSTPRNPATPRLSWRCHRPARLLCRTKPRRARRPRRRAAAADADRSAPGLGSRVRLLSCWLPEQRHASRVVVSRGAAAMGPEGQEAAPKGKTNAEASNFAVQLGCRCYRRSGAFATSIGRAS